MTLPIPLVFMLCPCCLILFPQSCSVLCKCSLPSIRLPNQLCVWLKMVQMVSTCYKAGL